MVKRFNKTKFKEKVQEDILNTNSILNWETMTLNEKFNIYEEHPEFMTKEQQEELQRAINIHNYKKINLIEYMIKKYKLFKKLNELSWLARIGIVLLVLSVSFFGIKVSPEVLHYLSILGSLF